MILKKTKLMMSRIHGIGLFADEDIKKDELVYQRSPGLDLKLSQDQFDKLHPLDKEVFLFYGYKNNDNTYCCDFGDIKFLNHKIDANLTKSGSGLIAKIDIAKGDELTQNYNEFENSYEKEKIKSFS